MGPWSETPVTVYSYQTKASIDWNRKKKEEKEEATQTFFSGKLSASAYTLQILYDIWLLCHEYSYN